jgi:hypothetical protein
VMRDMEVVFVVMLLTVDILITDRCILYNKNYGESFQLILIYHIHVSQIVQIVSNLLLFGLVRIPCIQTGAQTEQW